MLCYILCSLLRIPYATLVSVIVGVTNIIPFFGPFIGAVPSALIILMVSPLKALIFVIMILVIQQFDGNILSPKILGNKTGLNGFWVMFAILIGGGLFGFVGVLCGVPVFTVIYAGIRHLVSQGLKKRGLPEETADFIGLEHIDEETGQIVKRQVSPVTEAPVEAEDTPDEKENGGGGSPGAPGS